MKTSKITLAAVMKMAWAIAKEAAKKFGGSARQYMGGKSGALKAAWESIKNPKKTIAEKLIGIGGKLWEKGDYSRIYFGGWDDAVLISLLHLAGRKVRVDGKGYIKTITDADGDWLSNNDSYKIRSTMLARDFFFDVKKGEFSYCKNLLSTITA